MDEILTCQTTTNKHKCQGKVIYLLFIPNIMVTVRSLNQTSSEVHALLWKQKSSLTLTVFKRLHSFNDLVLLNSSLRKSQITFFFMLSHCSKPLVICQWIYEILDSIAFLEIIGWNTSEQRVEYWSCILILTICYNLSDFLTFSVIEKVPYHGTSF